MLQGFATRELPLVGETVEQCARLIGEELELPTDFSQLSSSNNSGETNEILTNRTTVLSREEEGKS